MDYNLASLVSLRPEAQNVIGKGAKTPFGPGKIIGFQILVCVETVKEDPQTAGRTNNYFELHKVELVP